MYRNNAKGFFAWILLAPWAICIFSMPAAALAVGRPSGDQPPIDAAEISIWPSLIAGMQLADLDRPEVHRFIEQYRAHPQSFTTMLARAEPFLWFVLHSAESRHLPTELALLPAVESGWDAQAISKSSAHGLWQFIERTGAAYGLNNALNYQARRDPLASTHAALDLLQTLHGEYGDWALALAAYNTGGVRLKAAMKSSGSSDFWQLPLPPVTRDYVPRLLAIAALVREPQRYGVELPPISRLPSAEVFAVDPEGLLRVAIRVAGLDRKMLGLYNPAIDVVDAPTRSPTFWLPSRHAITIRSELTALSRPPAKPMLPPVASPAPSHLAPTWSGRLHWQEALGAAGLQASTRKLLPTGSNPKGFHRVQRGETLFGIAQKHGLTVVQIQRLNPRAETLALLPGQLLLINPCASSCRSG